LGYSAPMLNRFFDVLRGRGARASAPPPATPAPSALPLDALRARLAQGDAATACLELNHLANLHPQDADVLALFGWALFELAEIGQAREVLAAALRLRPDHADALNTMGAMAAETDHPADAIGWFEDALDATPGSLPARYNLAQVLFLGGQYRRGFDLLRARHQLLFGRANQLEPMPAWQGEPLDGRGIFVWCDWGGLGDHLQFIRYVPLLMRQARPKGILLGAGREFARLFMRVEGVGGVLEPGHPPFTDVHCPLLDLPYLLGTDLDSVPHEIPYLSADPQEAAQWATQLDLAGAQARASNSDSLRVGLAWKSTGGAGESLIYQRMRQSKSVPAQLLGGLQESGARFVSLQMGATPYERALTGLEILDCSSGIRDFADTAAIIANLDLVISADTSVAHLAGAMGKPVLLLLRRESGLFWLHDRDDSPWYPSMRILRQPVSGDWAPVLEAAAAWLRVAAREGAAAVIPPR